MAKDLIISTSRVNSIGCRILTSGIDYAQYERNPVLLYMHRRGWDGSMPIGRVENIRVDGDSLIGTPVFDTEDEVGAQVSRKWDKDFLRMCSPCLEPVEVSTEQSLLMEGQTRATVTKSKLVEVSIVDIGSNDDALKLMHNNVELSLAAGVESEVLPLLKLADDNAPAAGEPATGADTETQNNNTKTMEKILLALGLAATATEDDAVTAIKGLQTKINAVELAHAQSIIDDAVAARKITEDKRETFMNLAKSAGVDALKTTLDCITPAQKPTELLNLGRGAAGAPKKWGELSEQELIQLRAEDKQEYMRLYKENYGIEPVME